MFCLKHLLAFLRSLATPRTRIMLENIALRQQLCVLSRQRKRPRLRRVDRVFWVWLARIWSGWRASLFIVKPEAVVRWHRQGWKLYWRWKCRPKSGRPPVDREIRDLVRCLARENPLWGAPPIHSELLKLGFVVAETTEGKYMPKRDKPRSATWGAFLRNHGLVACDFFTVPTLTFGVLYVLIVMRHRDRQLQHVSVTKNPTAAWTAQQVRQAFPFDEAPKYLLHDNDAVYSADFSLAVKNMGITEVRTAKSSPWQNPFAERLVGSIRRECVDHFVPLGERHLQKVLEGYQRYYNEIRCHLGLGKESPEPRDVEPPELGAEIIGIPYIGGLRHRYTRRSVDYGAKMYHRA
ncbi:MAG: transposase [Gemmatimonadales bacterium]|nr:MAG: transposase [Gemmatimonadales bacterium]